MPHNNHVLPSASVTELLVDLLDVSLEFGVSRLADVSGLDNLGVPVVSAIRPGARSLSVSSGRGTTLEKAKISALMEGFEAHCSETFAPTCVRATYSQAAARGSAVNPALLPHHPSADLSEEMWWCKGRSLSSGEPVLVPFEAVHTDWSRAVNNSGFVCDSTGIGAGLTASQAVLHGLYELIERDAMSLSTMRAEPETTPPVAPVVATPPDFPLIRAASTRCVLIESDTHTPVVAGFVWDTNPNPFRPLPVGMGTAAGPTVRNAATRALTEAAQSRLITISGARDDLLPANYEAMFDSVHEATLRARLADNPSMIDARGLEQHAHELDHLSTEEQATELVSRILRITGEPPVAIRLGELALPSGHIVVAERVIAPGLEGAGAQFGSPCAPGRRGQEALA